MVRFLIHAASPNTVDVVVDALREKLAPEDDVDTEANTGEKNHTASLLEALRTNPTIRIVWRGADGCGWHCS